MAAMLNGLIEDPNVVFFVASAPYLWIRKQLIIPENQDP
jgi:hypothetical protein|tara:strand:+ start:71 stop:187 length:117 start_codon:yes stop_codon:yes gene_type:complete